MSSLSCIECARLFNEIYSFLLNKEVDEELDEAVNKEVDRKLDEEVNKEVHMELDEEVDEEVMGER